MACRDLNPYDEVEVRIIEHLKDPPSNVVLATRVILACKVRGLRGGGRRKEEEGGERGL